MSFYVVCDKMPSYMSYRLLDVWIPSIAVCLIFLSLFIFVIFKVGLNHCQRKRRLVNRWFFEILRLAFRDLKRENNGRDSIYGQQIGQVSFALLVIIAVPVILSASFITFWNIYMVEEQIGTNCNPNFDCFPIENGEVLRSNPVHNCTGWPEGTDYRCYRLVYSYVQGVSATGGLLFFASVMLKIYTATLLAPHNIHNVCCKWMCYLTVIVGGNTVTALFILLHTTVPHPHDTVFRTATYQIQFCLYSFLLFVVFFVTGPLLIYGIECESPRRYSRYSEQDIESALDITSV